MTVRVWCGLTGDGEQDRQVAEAAKVVRVVGAVGVGIAGDDALHEVSGRVRSSDGAQGVGQADGAREAVRVAGVEEPSPPTSQAAG
jgi:hypothetical protein